MTDRQFRTTGQDSGNMNPQFGRRTRDQEIFRTTNRNYDVRGYGNFLGQQRDHKNKQEKLSKLKNKYNEMMMFHFEDQKPIRQEKRGNTFSNSAKRNYFQKTERLKTGKV